METEKLTRTELRMLTEALTFWIIEISNNPKQNKSIEERKRYKELFVKVVRMMKTENEEVKQKISMP